MKTSPHRSLARRFSLAAFLCGCLLLLVAVPRSSAEDFKTLAKEYKKAVEQAGKLRREAKTDEDRQKADQQYPNLEVYAGRFMALAGEDIKSKTAADCLAWVIVEATYSPQVAKAVDLLLEHHVDSGKLEPVAQALAHSQEPNTEKLLRAIVTRNPDAGVVNQAVYSLAAFLLDHNPESASSQAEAEKLLDRLAGGNSSLAGQAKGRLFEIRNLAIGKTAPEIEGKDIEGGKFKLSEFRGRVVVLDFWGDW